MLEGFMQYVNLGRAGGKDRVGLLLDASAVVNLILQRGSKALTTTRENFSLDLTGYETGNALWRLCRLERKITRDEASAFLGTATDFLTHLRQIPFEELDPNRILDIAISERLTFYAASYIVASETKRLTLVTDDEELLKVAKEYVTTQRPAQI